MVASLPRKLLRSLPTLTEVVASPSATDAAPSGGATGAPNLPAEPAPAGVGSPTVVPEAEEALIERVLARLDVSLEARVQQVIHEVLQEQLKELAPRIRQRVDNAVRKAVQQAVAEETLPGKGRVRRGS